MVPLPRYTTIGGIPLPDLMADDTIDAIVNRTKTGGGEIVKLMGTSAWYAPGAAAAEMVEAMIKDSGRVLPCAAWLTGQYGLSDLFIGVPARLGKNGIEEIIEVDLNDDEQQLMNESAQHVRDNLEALDRLQEAGQLG